jgi:hypothetical protein
MHRFIDGEDRMQRTLLPNSLEDYVSEENPVRVVEVFVDELDLAALGFSGMTPAATGRPAYHPSTLLKIEHPFGTLKAWMGNTHFLARTIDKVRTEMSLHVLAYN